MSGVEKLPFVSRGDRLFELTGARDIAHFDLHTHTVFCDGHDTPEEMAASAAARGLDCLGFSGHSYTSFDESYCMSKNGMEEYRVRVASLREQYRDRMNILCGVEQDFYSDEDTDWCDYVIGSVHYLLIGSRYYAIDETPETLFEAVRALGGDIYDLAGEYFRTVSRLVEKTHADVIGHFDLISKFNGDGSLFDESDPRYASAWRSAADELIKKCVPFEINTGAISRGRRHVPYPAPMMTKYIARRGGRFILSSDSHSKDTLAFGFEDYI